MKSLFHFLGHSSVSKQQQQQDARQGVFQHFHAKNLSAPATAASSKKKKRKKKQKIDLPDELLICIFKFMNAQELAKSVAPTCRKFNFLWVQSVSRVDVVGKLRKLKEDEFIRVVRKFVRLETLDVCNSGSSEDFQITDKGLLQLAHKFIYSNADLIARQQPNDPLSGEYNFAFDYEQHLDSIDSMTEGITEDESSLASTIDEDDCKSSFSSSVNQDAILENANKQQQQQQQQQQYFAPDDDMLDEGAAAELNNDQQQQQQQDQQVVNLNQQNNITSPATPTKKRRPHRYHLPHLHYAHIYYHYPPPHHKLYHHVVQQQQSQQGPLYGLHTLQSINLLGCHYVTENGVKYLTYICQNIKHLYLKGCTKVNDEALKYIAQFEHLETLDLTGCTHITNNGLLYLSAIKSKKLTFLDLTFCHQVTDEGMRHLATIKTLTDVNLQCCSKLTAKGVGYLLQSCRQMKSLNLTGCSLVTLCSIQLQESGGSSNSGNQNNSNNNSNNNSSNNSNEYSNATRVNKLNESQSLETLPNLQKINMMGCKSTCDDCLRRLISWTRNLTEAILAYSEEVTDEGVELFVAAQKNLSVLNLKRCIQITDKSLEAISVHLRETITHLNLTGCRHFTSKGLGYLAALHHLKYLALRKCQQINNNGLQYLCMNAALETLDLSENNQISEQGLGILCASLCSKQKNASGLKHIQLKKCQKLTKEFKTQLLETYPGLILS